MTDAQIARIKTAAKELEAALLGVPDSDWEVSFGDRYTRSPESTEGFRVKRGLTVTLKNQVIA